MTGVVVEPCGDAIRIEGPVTMATAAKVEESFRNLLPKLSGERTITLDCAGIDMADSAAVALLVEVYGMLTAEGRSLHIESLGEHLVSLVKVYGVEWILDKSDG